MIVSIYAINGHSVLLHCFNHEELYSGDGGVKHRQDGSARYGRSVILVRKGCGDDGDKSRDSSDDD